MNHFGFQDLGPAQPPEPNATLVWHEDLADGHRPHTDHVHNHNRSIDEIEYRNHQPVLTKSRGIVYSTSLRMEFFFYLRDKSVNAPAASNVVFTAAKLPAAPPQQETYLVSDPVKAINAMI